MFSDSCDHNIIFDNKCTTYVKVFGICCYLRQWQLG